MNRDLRWLGSVLISSATFITINSPVIAKISESEDENSTHFRDTAVFIAQSGLPDPNRERFTQPQPDPVPPKAPEPILPSPDPSQTSPTGEQPGADVPIEVTRIDVVGSTVLAESEINPIIQPLEGKTVTLADLNTAAQDITKLYLAKGYLTSRAIVSPQTITDGVVQIQIVEGSLESIDIEGNNRLNTGYIRSRIEQGVDEPLNTNDLEDQLQLLKADPLLDNIDATLQAGQGKGKSQLKLEVDEVSSLILGANVDNYTTPSTGLVRAGVTVGNRNLTGNGDSLLASYNRSVTGGLNTIDASYTIPVNAKNGTVQLRTIIQRNEITEGRFNVLDIDSDSERYSLSFRQPLIRNPREEFALSLGFSHQRNRGFITTDAFPIDNVFRPTIPGADANGITRTSIIQFGQDYTHRDSSGVWALRSQFNLGVDIGATSNPDPIPDGEFFSWLAQAQRVQRLGKNNLLIMQADLQLTPDSLLSSEQFTVGGAQSVRGYRQNALSGDNGFRFSLENRIALAKNEEGSPVFQVAPFVDLGVVFNSNNPNPVGDDNFIIGLGLGLLWEPVPEINIRLDYAPPIIDLNRGNDIQDHGFYFSINYLR
ncbi:ShlB/FhaC/HecB family hemolysin secretion/activation protein [Acaryochloris marina NIES-2412]|uniref:ShlB/FhaC/HecB family hemolysin secretion/activation protein n=1 Tax=Acaryochloris marina TaxID=155978 RepID=UPI00405949AF